jgi:low affinity Fe/Cu permease
MTELFSKIAQWTSRRAGCASTFGIAVLVVVIWAVAGPLFGFSDTWQLIINTGTTIVTFLMVFLIQHTQNRDTQAIHIKLDELIRATNQARNTLINLEDDSDEKLWRVKQEFSAVKNSASDAPKENLEEVQEFMAEFRETLGNIERKLG